MCSEECGCLTAVYSQSSRHEFLGRYFSVNGALYKYGIITVVTQNDERCTSSEMQSEGVSVPKGHNLYR